MRKEKLEKNLNIYYECLCKVYENKDIEPLIDVLYTLVEIYDDGLHKTYDINGVDAKLVKNNKALFIDTTIEFFTKLVKNNDDNILEEYVNISFNNGAKWYDITYFLYALIYPSDYYNKDVKRYYGVFKTLATNYVYHENNDNYYIRIQQYLEEYKEYFDKIEWIPLKDLNRKIYLNHIISIVIANLYLDDITFYKLPKIIDYVYNNLEYIKDFMDTNSNKTEGDSYKLNRILVSKILSDIEDDKKAIM